MVYTAQLASRPRVVPVNYGYDLAGRIVSVAPPDLRPWTLAYNNTGRINSAARLAGPRPAPASIGVPLIADTSATAGSASGTDLRDGEVHYLNINGREVNTALCAGAWHVELTGRLPDWPRAQRAQPAIPEDGRRSRSGHCPRSRLGGGNHRRPRA